MERDEGRDGFANVYTLEANDLNDADAYKVTNVARLCDICVDYSRTEAHSTMFTAIPLNQTALRLQRTLVCRDPAKRLFPGGR